MTLQQPSSATAIFLDQPPSCLQFHPSSPNHFLVGTYLLSEHKDASTDSIQQTKTGSLQLWHLNPATNELSLLQKYALPYAVFDLHFHPTNPTLAAIATSAASVVFFRITPPTEGASSSSSSSSGTASFITELHTQSVHEDPSIPALYLAWLPQNWPNPNPNSTSSSSDGNASGFAVTFSDGRTTLFHHPSPSSSPIPITEGDSFPANQEIEVWYVAAATYPETSTEEETSTPYLFTGNDFGSLHTRSFSATDTDTETTCLLSHDDRARHHTAGVTSIVPLPVPMTDGAPWLLTGSYDECLRVYHASRRGEVLGEVGLGGGVWRLQVLSSSEGLSGGEGEGKEWVFLVLASCMHAGTRVVRVRLVPGVRCEMEVLAEFTEHESMNYASDVWKSKGGYDLQGRKEGDEVVCVSSSFYDRRVCVWRVNV
ncbi:hypothetical protein BO94DRAFT_60942 [Aspergillus sclerotioniger CBS 115572]|uniref:WD40 repeat-like protein n=1 Tax=Aspergillus sclerotioniger CBS 115572 TaxID=1450535 RepID=A0A317WNQ1_9EURO|nr:hypothetical protein BO94DRAFT_60942 [Aspergillus sclerotioniger CBS 115572]PWY88003.1 hypothetical protein BO94DRAFT_60942 [Aspergillus sclerotioniger CBS 115572]